MADKFTPGPWEYFHDHGWLVVESSDEKFYLKISKGSCSQKNIAEARLIAAAPELLASVRELLGAMMKKSAMMDKDDWTIVNQALNNINKAVGEPS